MALLSYSSSSLVMYAMLVWYSVALFPILSTNASWLTDNCKKAKDPEYCLKTMNSDPRTGIANPLDHETISIDLATAQTAINKRQIQIFFGQTSDPRLKDIYAICEKYYDAALEAMTEAKRLSYQLKHKNVVGISQTAFNDAVNCEKTFLQPPSRKSTLSEQTHLMDLRINIVQVFATALISYPPK